MVFFYFILIQLIMQLSSNKKFPLYGWTGVILIIIFWFLNWNLDGLRTHILFFPLWLGYALTVDALVFYRKGNSLLTRSLRKYISLFLISAPAWWLFELFNLRVENWIYDGKHFFSDFEYAIYATFSFSTVIPAVFGSAELVSSFNLINKLSERIKLRFSDKRVTIMFISGWIMLALLILFPRYFYVFTWMSVYFILEPANVYLKNPSLIKYVSEGNWKPVISLIIGCLICGFFWEMWNFYSYPKWIYNVPFVDFFRIFEMPIVGYFGYIPFSFELFALYHLVNGFFSKNKNYLSLS
jgi:hypothetical protein